MAEIALRTTERKVQKAKHLAWRPVGSAMVCQSDHTICRKWLEICCDLVSPKKRENYRGLPGWRRLCEAWTPQLREAWLEYDRPTETHKLSRLLEDRTFGATVWNDLIVPIGVVADLPLAPESDVPVHRTWLWSEGERKRYFIVVNTDADSETVDNWNGAEERDAATGLVLPMLAEGEVRDPEISVAIMPRRQCKYKTGLGLSAGTLADIADPAKVKHPRFDKPVGKDKIKQPLVEDRDDQ